MAKGKKYDVNKLRYDLMPPEALEGIVEILTFGAQKYDDNNWKYVEDPERRYYAAAMRHLQAWKKGEKIDYESGRSHLYHALCCIIFLSEFDNQQKPKKDKKNDCKTYSVSW